MNQPLAFVTGATGLLGNNLVRMLVQAGYRVRAMVRDPAKGERQLGDLAAQAVEIVVGDLTDVAALRPHLQQVDVLFHTAAYFRDSYAGGRHAAALRRTNVDGTRDLWREAYAAGVRRFVHTSSIAVLANTRNGTVDEEQLQTDKTAVDDYYRSKIDTDEVTLDFLRAHPDVRLSLVLPGWMHGPGDAGPTSAGQFVLDYLHRRLPGVVDAATSFVDARDVAAVMIAAAERGQNGRRYLAAGYAVKMRDLLAAMEHVSGQPAPRRAVPTWLVYGIAAVQEAYARLTGKPVLLSLATVRNMVNDYGRRFSSDRIKTEFGLGFRPMEETLADEIAWFRARGLWAAS